MGREREPDRPNEPDEVAQATDEYYHGAPTQNQAPMPFKDMPEPLSLGKVLGPSVILAGIGVGSGEYIIWPFIAANVGIVMLWAAIVGVTLQFFINMEIERYTLTGISGAVSAGPVRAAPSRLSQGMRGAGCRKAIQSRP